jgi:hypothetical protein
LKGNLGGIQDMAVSYPDKKGKVFYGWWIVLVISILSTYGNGVFYYGFSTFVKPVVQEMAWSMTVVSGAFSFYRLEAGIAAPIVGYLLDRIGPPQQSIFIEGVNFGIVPSVFMGTFGNIMTPVVTFGSITLEVYNNTNTTLQAKLP